MAIGELINITLDSIAAGGQAIGRFQGKPVFTEGGAPNETALCRIIEDRKTWIKAELLEIVEASPARVKPVCPHYTQCGGCNLQHVDYETQLAVKATILKDSFLRIGGFTPPMIEVFASPQYSYRNRMQFHCIREKSQQMRTCGTTRINTNKELVDQKFGLKGRKSLEVIPVTDCPIAEAGIRELLRKGGQTLALPPEKDRFTVFSKDGLILSEGGNERGKINLLGKEIIVDASVFFQSNLVMLEKLIPELKKAAERANNSLPMADLYCGVGTFALFLGDMFPKAILAEENKKAVSMARENLKNGIVEFAALRDTEWPRTILRQKEEIGFAVIDPPRAGLSPKLAEALAQNGPPLLAYVSCDAATLARDSKILTGGGASGKCGYKLKELKLFDFYPQTAHIESFAVFERN